MTMKKENFCFLLDCRNFLFEICDRDEINVISTNSTLTPKCLNPGLSLINFLPVESFSNLNELQFHMVLGRNMLWAFFLNIRKSSVLIKS